MGLLFEGITLESGLTFIAFVVILMAINEATRRSKYVSIAVFCIAPIILAILVFGPGVLGSPTGKTWFGWVKVVSALIGVYGFLLIRFTSLGQKRFAAIFPVTILSLNIAEAVFREFQVFQTYKELTTDAGGVLIVGEPWNILNAIAGILTIVTLAGFAGITVSKDKTRDMVWPDMTWMYIVGYTLWNFAYVYNCISTRSAYAGFGILLAALLAELIFKQGVWLQHRAQILSVYAMFSLTVDYQSSSAFQILPTYTEVARWTISIVAILFTIYVFVNMIFVAKKKGKNPLKEDIYTETAYYQKTRKENMI